MPPVTSQLLSSIVDITEQRDCSRFRESLCKTLRELTPVQSIAFVRPFYKTRANGEVPALYDTALHDPPIETHTPIADRLDSLTDALHPQRVTEMMRNGSSLSIGSSHTTLLLPIISCEHLIEIFVVRARTLTQDNLFVLRTFARLYRNFLGLINESERDALTGLYNRRVLEEKLATIIKSVNRQHTHALRSHDQRKETATQRPFLAVFDIDKFKRINDTLGHLFGDEIILLMAQLMKEIFRGHDAQFRYGGDEFIVILMADSPADARQALERFRVRVAEHHFPQISHISTSIGFVEIKAGELASNVIGQADQALYQSKKNGRNCVSYYSDLVAQGDVQKVVEHKDAEMF